MFPKLGRGQIKIDVFSGSEKLIAPDDDDDDDYDDHDDDDDVDNAEYVDENAQEFRGLTLSEPPHSIFQGFKKGSIGIHVG